MNLKHENKLNFTDFIKDFRIFPRAIWVSNPSICPEGTNGQVEVNGALVLRADDGWVEGCMQADDILLVSVARLHDMPNIFSIFHAKSLPCDVNKN